MLIIIWILGSTVVVSLLALIGIFAFAIQEKLLRRVLLILVAFAAGTLMGGAFLHLLPESVENAPSGTACLSVLVGFILFFLIERVLYWRHCHEGKCDVHTFTYMNLIGDGIHNFIDGVIIAVTYLVSIPLGVASTLAIIAHEIPQEIGDFGILVYGGFTKIRALFFNFLSAITAILGALVGFFLTGSVEMTVPIILPFAAGGFIYIAASDLVPELHKEPDVKKSFLSFIFFILGVVLMWALRLVFQ